MLLFIYGMDHKHMERTVLRPPWMGVKLRSLNMINTENALLKLLI